MSCLASRFLCFAFFGLCRSNAGSFRFLCFQGTSACGNSDLLFFGSRCLGLDSGLLLLPCQPLRLLSKFLLFSRCVQGLLRSLALATRRISILNNRRLKLCSFLAGLHCLVPGHSRCREGRLSGLPLVVHAFFGGVCFCFCLTGRCLCFNRAASCIGSRLLCCLGNLGCLLLCSLCLGYFFQSIFRLSGELAGLLKFLFSFCMKLISSLHLCEGVGRLLVCGFLRLLRGKLLRCRLWGALRGLTATTPTPQTGAPD